jgi:hypothetical protein
MAPHRPFLFTCVTKLSTGALCNRGFRNRSGLTQHIHVQHRKFAPKSPSTPPESPGSPGPVNEFEEEILNEGLEDGEQPEAQNTEVKVVKHPILDDTSIFKHVAIMLITQIFRNTV